MWYTRVVSYFVNLVFSLIEIILLVRFLLKMFAANPLAPFVNWIYDISAIFLYPFRGIFPTPILSGGFRLEINTLFAIFIYAVIVWVIDAFLSFLTGSRSRRRSDYYRDDEI